MTSNEKNKNGKMLALRETERTNKTLDVNRIEHVIKFYNHMHTQRARTIFFENSFVKIIYSSK